MALDPFTALSLAGNVVQFLSFAGSILSKGRELYVSPDGLLSENTDIGLVTNDLIGLNNRLRQSMRGGSNSGRDNANEKALGDLISGCVAVAQELLGSLDALALKGKKHRNWEAFRKGLRAVTGKRKVESIQGRLALYRQELELHLLVLLREQVDLQQVEQSQKFQALDKTNQDISRAILQGQDAFKVILQGHADRMEYLQKRGNLHLTEAHIQSYDGPAPPKLQIRPVYGRGGFTPWEDIHLADQSIMRDIRDSLYYPMIKERRREIEPAYKETFEWIFHEPSRQTRRWDSFISWLEGDEPVYWINGKPGSGKSTLMKYLYGHPTTLETVRRWAGVKKEDARYDAEEAKKNKKPKVKLIRAEFYFWNSGHAIQKTQEGLLRSLLWRVLDQCPDLIPIVLGDEANQENRRAIRAGMFEWSKAKLKYLMTNLLTQGQLPIKLFLLIDGLDEYDGDHFELADWLMRTASKDVKIVLSSRPWNAFRETFAEVPQLRLQDLSYGDITAYVDGHLRSFPRMQALIKSEPEPTLQLITDLVNKANGVFLWVRLVVASLLDGLRNYDKISDLQARLLLLPTDLESLYDHMLKNAQGFYRYSLSRHIQLRQASLEPPLTLAFYFASEEDAHSLLTKSRDLMTRGEALEICEQMERQLQASCSGLLEVDYRERGQLAEKDRVGVLRNHDYYCSAFGSRIQYIHRTVRDFFERPDVAAEIHSARKHSSFDPDLALAQAWAARILRLPVENMKLTMDCVGVGNMTQICEEAKTFARASKPASKKAAKALMDFFDSVEGCQPSNATSWARDKKRAHERLLKALDWKYEPVIGTPGLNHTGQIHDDGDIPEDVGDAMETTAGTMEVPQASGKSDEVEAKKLEETPSNQETEKIGEGQKTRQYSENWRKLLCCMTNEVDN
ncbi:hypothetical protein F4677DRAFT_443950 [Hypoxylon crocopeplum]|nr:hypothetical protein F4677DRAFT_443950 [Hypoxylon crocopeplum]